MAAVFEKTFIQDLTGRLIVRYCPEIVFSKDNLSNQINVKLYVGPNEYAGGGTVTATVIRSDGNTVPVSGSISGNVVSVTLIEACMEVPGQIQVFIRLTSGNVKTTIFAGVFTAIRTETDAVIDPGTIIPSVTDLINQIQTAIDSIPADYSTLLGSVAGTYSASKTYAVGDYVWYNGQLYRCSTAITTAESWTAGHWTQAVLGNDVSDLKSNFDKVDEALITQETRTQVVTADSGATWENGYYWSQEYGVMVKKAYAATSCAIYGNVQKGDIFRVTARSAGSAYALYLADGNGNFLDYFVSPSGNNYYGDAEYMVPSDGVLYLNTVTEGYLTGTKYYALDTIVRSYLPISTLQEKINTVEADTDKNSESLNDLISSIPTKDIFVDVIGDLTFIDGKFVSDSGTVTSYANTKYAVYGAVTKGKLFKFSGRKVGSCYCILLVDSAEPVSGKYTVLDVVKDGYNETSYITDALYTVPQNGYLIIQGLKSTPLALYISKTYFNIASSPLDNIKWVTIGDSLNEFNSTAKNNWIKYMIADTGVINTNLASSGTGFYRGIATDDYPTAANYIAKLSRIPADTQLITIAGSFNDLTTSPWPQLPVGTSSDTGTETIAGYMNDFFDALINAFPLVPIGVYMTAPWNNYHYGVERSDAYVTVLKEICLKKGIPFFDNAYYGNTLKPWNTANRTEYYTHDNGTVDGVHPNDKGHVFIYQMLKPFIESLSPKNPLTDINS